MLQVIGLEEPMRDYYMIDNLLGTCSLRSQDKATCAGVFSLPCVGQLAVMTPIGRVEGLTPTNAANQKKMACAICDSDRTPLEVASCGQLRHGACRHCLRAALCQPLERHPLSSSNGSMGCVAMGCTGRFALRDLLSILETKAERAHVLSVVTAIRNREVHHETDASRLRTKQQRLKAAVHFLQKPQIAARDRESIGAYLRENGVEDDVLTAAIDIVDGKQELEECFVERESMLGSTHHAPVFVGGNEETPEHVEAVSAEQELLQVKPDLLLMPQPKKKVARRALRQEIDKQATAAAECLTQDGWACLDDFASLEVVQKIRAEIDDLRPFYSASEIWVGASAAVGAQVVVPSVRGDHVLWMCGGHQQCSKDAGVEPCDEGVRRKFRLTKSGGAKRLDQSMVAMFPHLKAHLKAVDKFVLGHLTHKLPYKLGDLDSRSDAMLAVYPGNGSRFQAHVDNTSQDGRKLTVLTYLNPDWTPCCGGQLRLHFDRCPSKDIFPIAGRLVLFYADQVKHEVRPTWDKARVAITVWYYSKNERKAALAKATLPAVDTSDDDRRLARQFAESLCDPNVTDDVSSLAEQAERLPLNSQKILAHMVGVPASHFAVAVSRLSPTDLANLKTRFARMGV